MSCKHITRRTINNAINCYNNNNNIQCASRLLHNSTQSIQHNNTQCTTILHKQSQYTSLYTQQLRYKNKARVVAAQQADDNDQDTEHTTTDNVAPTGIEDHVLQLTDKDQARYVM